MQETQNKVKELQAAKSGLISRYMSMQDEADEMNRRIYDLCCEIEALNLQIEIAVAEEQKKLHAQNGKARSNGHPVK